MQQVHGSFGFPGVTPDHMEIARRSGFLNFQAASFGRVTHRATESVDVHDLVRGGGTGLV
jgi:hypothetical protein